MQLFTCGGAANGSIFTTANKYLFANLLLSESGEGDETTSPSFPAENAVIDASISSLEAPIATFYMRGAANGSVFTTENKYLFADLLLSESGEGDETTSPSFPAENAMIDASNSSLEAPIATFYMRGGCERERFHNGKQIPVCRSFVV